MSKPSAIAVFCGSKPGADARHMQTARDFGREMAARGISLVYGGGRLGLMGAVADAVKAGGGHVTGVIPEFLMKLEVGNDDIDVLEVTDSMHSRKTRMFDLSDAFVSLAGGLGTLDETVEIITWKQLGLHDKPIVVLNDGGYWDLLPAITAGFIDAGFANPTASALYTVADSIDAVFQAIARSGPTSLRTDSERL